MKKNLYYRRVFQRVNLPKEILVNIFLSLASWPRMLLEVFIRRNFGERYFSSFTAFTLVIILALFPFLVSGGFSRLGGSLSYVVGHNISWYLYIVAFIAACVMRKREIARLPSVFDFARFSLSAGEVNPRFRAVRFRGKPVTIRTIEILLEPGFFFLIGLVLWFLDLDVGILLMVCAVLYSLSYMAAYHKGDQFIMDQIDEMICNEELVSSFVDELDSSQTRGVNFYGRRPADPNTRRRVADRFMDDDDFVIAT